ncbi:MAG: hypothetical protein H7099_03665 [Gemmatimonadaceae bacterium]|nr:hypothetical protein [Gemmatimonadaceae bacterium]
MKPSKPFLFLLAVVAVAAFVVVETPRAVSAQAQDSMPMTTRLTPAMIDYFALDVAYDRPSMTALVACAAVPACGSSDSSQVRFLDADGRVAAKYDATPTMTIEQVRRQHSVQAPGVTDDRTSMRRFSTDAQGRIVMQGSDSIVTRTVATSGTPATIVTRVRRYSDVRYLVNDVTHIWPITGLVTLELSRVIGSAPRTPVPLLGHAAVSYDGTPYAHILTSGALTHRVNLRARSLETTMPDR